MSKYQLIVLSNPLSGRETEYNEWYSNFHVPETKALPGVASGRRFRVLEDKPWKYVAAYDLDCADPVKWFADAMQSMASMTPSDSFDPKSVFTMLLQPLDDGGSS